MGFRKRVDSGRTAPPPEGCGPQHPRSAPADTANMGRVVRLYGDSQAATRKKWKTRGEGEGPLSAAGQRRREAYLFLAND